MIIFLPKFINILQDFWKLSKYVTWVQFFKHNIELCLKFMHNPHFYYCNVYCPLRETKQSTQRAQTLPRLKCQPKVIQDLNPD